LRSKLTDRKTSKEKTITVSIVEGFGFESHSTNGFEELMNNFAAEKLYSLFLESTVMGLKVSQG
jgi:myosin heavy subunit